MSFQDETAEDNSTTNIETDDSTEQENQASLEAETPEYEPEDDGLTDAQRRFKEQRREENRKAREALKEVPQLKAELEFNKFLRKTPEAEDYEQDIQEFRAKNPTIWLDQAFRYVLADKDPIRLAELTDSGKFAQRTQGKTAPLGWEKSFSEQVWQNIDLNDINALRKAAEKAYAKNFG